MRHSLETTDPTSNEFKDMVTGSATADLEAIVVAHRGREVAGDGAREPSSRMWHRPPNRRPTGRAELHCLSEQ